jgi:transposase
MTDDGTSGKKKPGPKRARNGRFPPGVCGNPGGRPKGSRNLRTDLNELMNKKILVRENGKARSLRGQMAILTRLLEKALQGDIRAANKLVDTVIKLNPPTSSVNEVEDVLLETDEALIAAFLRDATPSETGELPAQATPPECSLPAVGDRTAAEPNGVCTDLDARMSAGHPLRRLRELADAAMTVLDAEFGAHAIIAGPTISPDKLVRTWLLRLFYTISNEDLVVDELEYNPVHRWFVGLRIDEPAHILVEFTKTLNSLHGGQFIRRFTHTFFANNDVKVFLLSDQAYFSMLARLAEWHGYLPQSTVGAEDDESVTKE